MARARTELNPQAKAGARYLRISASKQNQDLAAHELFVKEVRADEGPTLKRFRPRALGRAYRIRKRTSHLRITLQRRAPETVARPRGGAGQASRRPWRRAEAQSQMGTQSGQAPSGRRRDEGTKKAPDEAKRTRRSVRDRATGRAAGRGAGRGGDKRGS